MGDICWSAIRRYYILWVPGYACIHGILKFDTINYIKCLGVSRSMPRNKTGSNFNFKHCTC